MSKAEIITLIVKIIFAILSVALTSFVIPYLRTLTEKNMDSRLNNFLKDAVKAAEQTIKGSGKGEEKKAKVLAAASEWLKKYNIELTDDELSDMIESLVFSMNHEEII
jgi:LL-H family phage holin